MAYKVSLSNAEAAARALRAQTRRFDTDGDAKLSKSERQARDGLAA
jgi:hypothetical protein